MYKPTNENDLFAMLSAGPVGVGVVGQNTGFLSYGGGVFDEVLCTSRCLLRFTRPLRAQCMCSTLCVACGVLQANIRM